MTPVGAAAATNPQMPHEISAEFRRARFRERRQRIGGPTRPRVSASAGINESQVYPMGAASAEERQQREMERAAKMDAERRWIHQQTQQPPLPAIVEQAQQQGVMPDISPMVDTTKQLMNEDRELSFADPARRKVKRKIQQNMERMAKKAAKKMAKKFKEETRDMIWHLWGRGGSAAESEHAGGGTVFWTGGLISIFQVVKTILVGWKTGGKSIVNDAVGDLKANMPGQDNADNDEEESTDFLKGFLSFLEPNTLDIKKGQTWIAIKYAILVFFVMVAVFTLINAGFAFLGMILLLPNLLGLA
ncbi:MAG: hypothetical protein ABIA47_03470 [bacterium]